MAGLFHGNQGQKGRADDPPVGRVSPGGRRAARGGGPCHPAQSCRPALATGRLSWRGHLLCDQRLRHHPHSGGGTARRQLQPSCLLAPSCPPDYSGSGRAACDRALLGLVPAVTCTDRTVLAGLPRVGGLRPEYRALDRCRLLFARGRDRAAPASMEPRGRRAVLPCLSPHPALALAGRSGQAPADPYWLGRGQPGPGRRSGAPGHACGLLSVSTPRLGASGRWPCSPERLATRSAPADLHRARLGSHPAAAPDLPGFRCWAADRPADCGDSAGVLRRVPRWMFPGPAVGLSRSTATAMPPTLARSCGFPAAIRCRSPPRVVPWCPRRCGAPAARWPISSALAPRPTGFRP